MPGPTILENMGHEGTASHTVHDNGTETYWFNDGTIATYGHNGLIESTAVEKIGFGGVFGPDYTVTRNADREIINVQDLSNSDPCSPTNANGSPQDDAQTQTSGGEYECRGRRWFGNLERRRRATGRWRGVSAIKFLCRYHENQWRE